jgi:UDP-N-acetyl-D-mannosaminuronic acid dehydrogenase
VYDVAVIGLGRVGLPLALAFADAGLRVLGIDNDPDRLDAVRSRRMPFKEPGTDELLERVAIDVSARASDAAQSDAIVLTLGTPMLAHVEIDLGDIRSVLDDLLPLLRTGQLLVLRSTVAPGTTDFVAGYLEKQRGLTAGEDVFVAHVPERIAADRFLEEISTLPCIVGGVGEASGERAARLFEALGAPIVQTSPVEAELAKIWTNILRYTTFALPNLLMMDCERYGANVFDVIELINRDYPRAGMAMPGLTAGTCLRKDFAFSEEKSNSPGMLLGVSRVHESVPLFLVDGVKRRLGSLRERKVAVLGLAFKRDTDDETRWRTSSCGCSSASWPTSRSTTRSSPRRARRSSRRSRTPMWSSSPPTTACSSVPRRWPPSPTARSRTASSWTPGTRSAPPRSSPTRTRSPRCAREPGPGHRRGRHDRQRRRAAAARRPRLRGPRVRPAARAGLDARGLRGPHRRPARLRPGA